MKKHSSRGERGSVLFLIFLSILSFSQTNQNKDRILVYGKPFMAYREAMTLVGDKYNVVPYSVAGCMVSSELIDSVKISNAKVWKKKNQVYGGNFEKKYRKETKKELKRILELRDLLSSSKIIGKRIRAINRGSEYVFSEFEKLSEDGDVYYLTYYNYEKLRKPEFKVTVSYSKKEINIIELK